ncbi:Multidrug resistance protein MdtL [Streptomyces violaceorubidus]
MVTVYLVASMAVTPLWGKVSDLYGRRTVVQCAIGVFVVGSVLCGVAQSIGQLIVFRGIQGLGAGGLFVLALAVIADVVPPERRGRYQGLFGAVFGLSSVVGPLVGRAGSRTVRAGAGSPWSTCRSGCWPWWPPPSACASAVPSAGTPSTSPAPPWWPVPSCAPCCT